MVLYLCLVLGAPHVDLGLGPQTAKNGTDRDSVAMKALILPSVIVRNAPKTRNSAEKEILALTRTLFFKFPFRFDADTGIFVAAQPSPT